VGHSPRVDAAAVAVAATDAAAPGYRQGPERRRCPPRRSRSPPRRCPPIEAPSPAYGTGRRRRRASLPMPQAHEPCSRDPRM
jgi:hypothetical protein